MLTKHDSCFSCLNCISTALWDFDFNPDSSLGISKMIVGFNFLSQLGEFT